MTEEEVLETTDEQIENEQTVEDYVESVEIKPDQNLDEYIEESEKDVNESLEDAGIKIDDETQKMVDEIDWNIVEYEDPEQFIPVFNDEQWEKLGKLGALSPILYVNSQLGLLRMRVSEINTEEFQVMNDEEKKKEIDELYEIRNSIIAIVQSSVKHYDEMMSKENIASLDGIILSNTIQNVITKNIGEKIKGSIHSVFPMLLDSINNISSKKNILSVGFHCQFISTLESYMRYETKLKRLENSNSFKEIMDNKFKMYFSIIGEIISIMVGDVIDSTNVIHNYIKGNERCVELGKTMKEIETQFKEQIKTLIDNNREELDKRLFEPTKLYFDKVLKKVGKIDDEKNLNTKNSIELQNISLFNDYVTSLQNISPVFYIFEKFVILFGELFNESNGMGIDKVFTTQSMAQFFFMISLLRKYIFGEKIKTNEENFNKPLKEVYTDEEIFEQLEIISSDKEYHKGFKDIMFREDSAKDIIDSIINFIECSINDVKNSLEKIVDGTTENIVDILTYGRIYQKIQPFIVRNDNDVRQMPRKKKKKKR